MAARSLAIRQAEQLIVDDAPMIPLFVPIRWALVSPNITGWTPNILGAHPLSRLNKTIRTKGK
jgi:ABC-type oligopeptide transport system substrate-binding subunit